MLHRVLPILLLSLGLAACGDSKDPSPTDGGPSDDASPQLQDTGSDAGLSPNPDAQPGLDQGSPPADAGAPPTDAGIAWFDPEHVLDIRIEMDAIAWQSLREQGRDFQSLFGDPMCLDQPFDSPFTYFPGSVTVDGQTAANVGIRKKGFLGSLNTEKPSFKIKVHEYEPDQTLAGEKRITLNNSIQDPSLARTCLALHVFRELGLPAPRCNFARVRANGEDLGLYVHVEDVKKPFLRQHFADPDGALFEGTLSDFRPEWLGSFEDKADTPRPEDRAALLALTEAAARPIAELEAALEPVLDLDAFITYWATEAFLGHWDGYSANTNNFFAYQDPTDRRFRLIPWGPDTVFSGGPFLPLGVPASVSATGILAHRLHQIPSMRQRYLAELRRILDELTEARLFAFLDDLQTRLTPELSDATAFAAELDGLRGFMSFHRGRLEEELAQAAREWPIPLRGIPCPHVAGPIIVELASTFGTHPTNDPFQTGTGLMDLELDGVQLDAASIGSAVGFGVSADDAGDVVLVGLAVFPNGFSLLTYVAVDPSLVSQGAVLPFDDVSVRGAVFRAVSPTFDFQLQGPLTNGTVEILEGSATSSASFRARIEADVFESFRL